MKLQITIIRALIGKNHRTAALKRTLLSFAVATLTACSSIPNPPAASVVPAPAVIALDEWMERGNIALKSEDHVKAREAWRSAIKEYPTAKQPWLRLSEDYFNAADYGNAVLAAQEVLQRDTHDRVAHSVLAVSGLRLTAGSLAALRDDANYVVGSRDEAVAVTHSLREALGEPVLVPQLDPAPQHKRPARPSRPTSHVPDSATAQAPVGNPLDKLK